MRSDHVHTGFVAFLFAGVSAVVFIKLLSLGAAHLSTNERTEWLGSALGGLVNNNA